jgi:sugar phosphate isomerase/epimerase
MLNYNIGVNFLNNSYRELKEVYNLAYKHVKSDESRQVLEQFRNKILKDVEKINELDKKGQGNQESIELRKKIVEEGVETLSRIREIPQIFKPLDEFSRDKTTTTFANVAIESYKKFKDKAPIISIENPPVGAAFSRGEELKDIVEETRKKFVEKAKQEGMSESEARKNAEKLIGVTWDLGHINMLRKYGFEKEDIVNESEKVKKFVKHIHLSDNFGFEHTELPMGMGNVPFKEVMEKLGKEGFEAKKIVEASSWWQHFKSSPMGESMKALGSPIYSVEMAPYWNQYLGLHQGYFGGRGEMYPQINYETFGTSFTQLPVELGGNRGGGAGSRMGGRGME